MKRILYILFGVLIFMILFHSPPEEPYHMETYIVEAGDTAWTIMSENNTADKDIRKLIYYLEQDNDINAGYLQVGQILQIRIYERD